MDRKGLIRLLPAILLQLVQWFCLNRLDVRFCRWYLEPSSCKRMARSNCMGIWHVSGCMVDNSCRRCRVGGPSAIRRYHYHMVIAMPLIIVDIAAKPWGGFWGDGSVCEDLIFLSALAILAISALFFGPFRGDARLWTRLQN